MRPKTTDTCPLSADLRENEWIVMHILGFMESCMVLISSDG